MAEVEHKPPAAVSPAVDLFSGTVAGAAQLIVGHPFDTIKVKLQSQPKVAPGEAPLYTGAFDAIRKTLAHDGVRGLFKGMAVPLGTVALFNAVLFTTRGQMERLLTHADGSPLTAGDQVVAGLGAGVAVSFLACPTELIKCRLQAQGASKDGVARYRGPMDVIRHIQAERGALGVFKGLGPTFLREVPGNAIMFGTYELLKQGLAARQGLGSTKELGVGSLVVAGGLAGVAYWGPVFPADVVKSKIQVDDLRKPHYAGTADCFRKTLAAQGVAGLYKGAGPAITRSFPANAACFLVYELVRGLFEGAPLAPAETPNVKALLRTEG